MILRNVSGRQVSAILVLPSPDQPEDATRVHRVLVDNRDLGVVRDLHRLTATALDFNPPRLTR